ncbi:hypothetical protein [Microvirga aerilata]|uniref:hypothetical protein n=1 Tax=Microvirga aerilata TaxID=670292 RepID=UPI001923701D|nr:hypothetical protein [Microvirga aerilata]
MLFLVAISLLRSQKSYFNSSGFLKDEQAFQRHLQGRFGGLFISLPFRRNHHAPGTAAFGRIAKQAFAP